MMVWFRQKLLYLIVCAFLAFTINSCSNDKPEQATPDLGFDYFPLDSGWVKIYQIDSISFNDNTQTIDTFHFKLKETFSGVVESPDLFAHRVVYMEAKQDSSEDWLPRTSLFLLKTNNNLQWVEDNQRYIKLTFPAGQVQSWNGNAFNSLGRKNYQWQNLFSNFNNGDTVFSDCISVLEAQTNNLVEEIYIKNVYAKNIGLVDRTNTNINTQSTGRSGYKIRQKLLTFYH